MNPKGVIEMLGVRKKEAGPATPEPEKESAEPRSSGPETEPETVSESTESATPDAEPEAAPVAEGMAAPELDAEPDTNSVAEPDFDAGDSAETPEGEAAPAVAADDVEKAPRGGRLRAVPSALGGAARRGGALIGKAVPMTPGAHRRLTPILIVALVLVAIAGAVTAWNAVIAVGVESARADATAQAREKLPLVLSYKAATLDKDLDTARMQITGDFATRFDQLATSLIAPSTRAQKIATVATVSRAAPISGDSSAVQVLLYVDQSTTSATRPEGQKTSSQVRVTMAPGPEGQWLIAEVTPL